MKLSTIIILGGAGALLFVSKRPAATTLGQWQQFIEGGTPSQPGTPGAAAQHSPLSSLAHLVAPAIFGAAASSVGPAAQAPVVSTSIALPSASQSLLGQWQQFIEGGISVVRGTGRVVQIITNPTGPTSSVSPVGADGTTADVIGYVGEAPDSSTAVAAIESGELEVADLGLTTLLDLGSVLTALGVVALVVDIGFVIASDAPNAVKAINVAIDAASIVCLFIPYGWIIALVLQIVKFIFGLFSGRLFGGLTHEQREILEAARYSEHLHPMFPQIATSYSPRELLRVLIAWGSGYCGGQRSIAVETGLHNQPTPGSTMYFGSDTCYLNTGAAAGVTFDQQAMALATRGQTTDFFAYAQVGVGDQYREAFNAQVQNIVTARCVVYAEMAARGLTLDQMDTVAAEYRRTDRLNRVGRIFGYEGWREMFAAQVQAYWAPYITAHPVDGSLNHFAQSLGYADAIALRDAAMAPFQAIANRVMAMEDRLTFDESVVHGR